MPSLVDQFRPNVHDAAITAAAIDSHSGTVATADAAGVVAVTRAGERGPGLVLPGSGARVQALDVVRGGSLVAIGDDAGSVMVIRTDNGETMFSEHREGQRGLVRAMRGIALSPEGSQLASIAIDGLVRVWDLVRHKREVAWQGFGGSSVAFDARGERLLCVAKDGQPRLIDLRNREGLPMDRIQMAAERALFTADNTYVVCAGPSGISLLSVVDGVIRASFATRGGSGIANIALSPDGRQVAAISRRSVHFFELPELTPVSSLSHGAPDATGAAWWGRDGIRVGGSDGVLHGGGEQARGIAPVETVGAFGKLRVAVHQSQLALWSEDRRVGLLELGRPAEACAVSRDGLLIGVRFADGPVGVWSSRDGKQVFKGDKETVGAIDIAVGGSVVLVHLRGGGIRWWDLKTGQAFELRWPRVATLSGSGTWMGVVTPKGAVRILDPRSGKQVVHPPIPLAEVPISQLAFVNRRPELLVVDEDGVLGHYDLARSLREDRPIEGRDLLDFNVKVDRLWGLTGARHCALRLPSNGRCTVVFVDLTSCDVVSEVEGLHPEACVEPESGLIVEPASGGALLERERDGRERRVLRSLPGDQWLSFNERGLLAHSEGAGSAIG